MSSSAALDEFIERIVREVIRRLRAHQQSEQKAEATVVLTQRLITAASIEIIPTGTRKITIAARAVLTPLARDEARDRGMVIVRQTLGAAK